MPQRTRAAQVSATSPLSPSKLRKPSMPVQKLTRHTAATVPKKTLVKKPSPVKHEQASATVTRRQKRLSSLTAATLLQYCSTILSPSTHGQHQSNTKRKVRSTNTSPLARSIPKKTKTKTNLQASKDDDDATARGTPQKRQISTEVEPRPVPDEESNRPTRSRREASSRASAMIMQQNEIERSRFHYALSREPSAASLQRQQRTKRVLNTRNPIPPASTSPEPFTFSIPIAPAITHAPNPTEYAQSTLKPVPIAINSKSSRLTEANVTEHNRFLGTIPSYHATKRDNLLRWVREILPHDRSSSPVSEQEMSVEFSYGTTSIPIQRHDLMHSNRSMMLTQNSNPSGKTNASVAESSTATDTHGKSSTVSLPFATSNQNTRPSAKPTAAADPSISPFEQSHRHLLVPHPLPAPSFLGPTGAYPIDLRSFYPLVSCWQYPAWTFPTSASLLNSSPPVIDRKTPSKRSNAIHNSNHYHQPTSIIPINRPKSSAEKNESLTLHLHTHHHHHHVHQSASSSIKPIHTLKDQRVIDTRSIIPLNITRVSRSQHAPSSEPVDDQALNLSVEPDSLNERKVKIQETRRRKSYPVKRPVRAELKPNTPPASNGDPSPSHPSTPRYASRRRGVSATTTTTTTTTTRTVVKRTTRGARTQSSSVIPTRSKSLADRKRSHSSTSVTLPVSQKSTSQRKKQKITHYWTLFGKFERQLVSLKADQPPVYRKCYSSIRHITEREVIKSSDCVILRPETVTDRGSTPYLAQVKWFWEEPTSGEIQMSLMWYYHPDHTELSARAKAHFRPNELLASRFADCINVACIEDKCYVLNVNEYNRYCLREKAPDLFDPPAPVDALKSLVNRNTSTVHHRALPAENIDHENVFFCRYVYDYRTHRIRKNPSLNNSLSTANA